MHAVMFIERFLMLSETEERNIITRFICCAIKSSNLILRYQNTQSHEEVKRGTGSPGRPLASYVNPRCDKVIMKLLERNNIIAPVFCFLCGQYNFGDQKRFWHHFCLRFLIESPFQYSTMTGHFSTSAITIKTLSKHDRSCLCL